MMEQTLITPNWDTADDELMTTVAKIVIGEEAQFDKKSWFLPETEVVLYYYVNVG